MPGQQQSSMLVWNLERSFSLDHFIWNCKPSDLCEIPSRIGIHDIKDLDMLKASTQQSHPSMRAAFARLNNYQKKFIN